jgi:Holliday junction resolvase RusA-like endonuclease
VQLAYQAAGGRLYDGAVAVRITAHQALPKHATKAQRAAAERGEIHPIRKPDLDNIVKIVLDALNGSAYRDDTQVLQLDARKIYTAGESHITVTVGTLDEITPAPVDWAVGWKKENAK